MLPTISLTKKEACFLTIESQGLSNIKSNNTLDIIRQISYIQIDTISVTQRSHNHILFTRNPSFTPSEIDQLMAKKSIFEYWSHAAAYLPIEDYRFSLYPKQLYKSGKKHWFPRDKKIEKYVLDRIKSEGALQTKDFDSKGSIKHGWGPLKPAKMAMTNLFMDGDIMISKRVGFQKVFDLTERVIPSDIPTEIPSIEEYTKHLITKSIKANGFVSLQEIIYLRKNIKTTVSKLLDKLVDEKKLVLIKIEGIDITYYSTPEQLTILNKINNAQKQLHILNPFDNLIIQRKRIATLFDFEYLLECYIPQKKRKFGYYTLPILFKNKFVARLDAKANRKTKVFTVNKIWLENKFTPDNEFELLLEKQLLSYAKFCGCNQINNTSNFSF